MHRLQPLDTPLSLNRAIVHYVPHRLYSAQSSMDARYGIYTILTVAQKVAFELALRRRDSDDLPFLKHHDSTCQGQEAKRLRRGACGVVVSYKLPMLVCRVRFSAGA